MSSEKRFRVVRLEPVTTVREVVICETDDWIEAEVAQYDATQRATNPYWPKLRGIGEGHDLNGSGPDAECSYCGAPNNGCYKIHAPCGFEFTGQPMWTLMQEWRAEHSPAAASLSLGETKP